MKLYAMILKSKYSAPIFLFLFTLSIYVFNLSPSVYGGDSGDLLSAIITRGVPHPSGYPLYTILGILFSKLPISATFAWKVGMISAISTSLSVSIFYLITYELSKKKLLSLFSSLVFAFTYTVWLYAEITEVLSLNNFFVMLILYETLLLNKQKDLKHLYLLSLFLGLSLTNNLTILLIFPSIFVAVLYSSYKLLFKIKNILSSTLLFLFGFSNYLYIPISAKMNSSYSWGYAVNFNNFISLIFRKEYGWGLHMEGFIKDTISQLFQNYYFYWIEYVNIFIPLFILLGIFYFFRHKYYFPLLLFLSSFIMVGPFYLFYARMPIQSLITIAVYEKFYLAGFSILLLFFPFGIVTLLGATKKLAVRSNIKIAYEKSIYLFLVIFCVSIFINNQNKLNLRDNYIGDDFARDVLKNMPVGSIAFLTGDTKMFNSYYIQNAYVFRKDVYIPGRPDSFRGLLKYSPMSESEIEDYIVKRGGTLDRETFIKTLPLLVKNKEVFVDHSLQNFQIEYEDLGRIVFIPWGLTKKLYFEKTYKVPKDEYISDMKRITDGFQVDKILMQRGVVDHSVIYADIQMNYASSYYAIADFIANYYSDPQSASYFLKKSIELDPLK